MIEFIKKLFPKYYYEPEDIIYIRKTAVESGDKAPLLLRVEVVQRLFSGYIVVDADDNRFFIEHRYVVSKE